MIETIFSNNDVWGIILKALLTTLTTALIGLVCTCIGKLLIKIKNSKLRRHAKIAVEAAEMKFPNEGKKMGPEKMSYVMDYLAITFPKIKSNQYLYNIAEAAVFELNNERIKKESEQIFKDKYGELPEDIIINNSDEESVNNNTEENIDNNNNNVTNNVTKEETIKTTKITNIF